MYNNVHSESPIEASLGGAYEIASNGSLLVFAPVTVNAHRFECAIDYAISASR